MSAALDAGITLFDTADVYGDSEPVLGECPRGQRDRVILATDSATAQWTGDTGPRQGRRGDVPISAVPSSRPCVASARTTSISTRSIRPIRRPPIEETLAALTELVREGEVRYIGNSNFAAWQITEAACVARFSGYEPFVSAQNHWSLLHRDLEDEVVPAARHSGLGVLPYFPLANGLLTGEVRRGAAFPEGTRIAQSAYQVTEARLDTVESLIAWGAKRSLTLLDIAVGGLAASRAALR
ncbi:aldo/keto reductase [Streptomyces sp. NPDC049954]|uniref:aldo/keto reductase n=1 Tax=Streptomyces sp. NPDC049954 TaxID=3155779 RepID=UPI003438CD6D